MIDKGIGNLTRNVVPIVKAVKRPESGIVFARDLDTGGQKCYSILGERRCLVPDVKWEPRWLRAIAESGTKTPRALGRFRR